MSDLKTTRSAEAGRIVALMRESGQPLIASAKISRRPDTWRDHHGRLRHAGYPCMRCDPARFLFHVAGQRVSARGVRSLLRAGALSCFRSGWLVRSRFKLVEPANAR
jgi:hypothetical protein